MELIVFLFAAALLAVERVGYAWIWQRPEAFQAACKRAGLGEPIVVLQRLFYAFKLTQAAVFAIWCIYFGAITGWPETWMGPPGAAALALIAGGQLLNAAVFARLGRNGVFYGNRLGYAAPWREGFPFSWFEHPQYLGAVLTIWGIFLLLRYPHPDWFALPLVETAYYAISARLERLAQPVHSG